MAWVLSILDTKGTDSIIQTCPKHPSDIFKAIGSKIKETSYGHSELYHPKKITFYNDLRIIYEISIDMRTKGQKTCPQK